MKIAFLDRDGTINKDYSDKIWSGIRKPEILRGAISGLNYLKDKGFKFIIVTNQYIINDGYITLEDFNSFNQKLLKILSDYGIEILDVFFCPHSKNEYCKCYKPNPGLIQQALKKYPNIKLNESIVIGDSLCDEGLANYYNIDFYGIGLDCDNKIDNIGEIKKFIK